MVCSPSSRRWMMRRSWRGLTFMWVPGLVVEWRLRAPAWPV